MKEVINNNMVVSIRYRMKNGKGEMLDNNMDGPPVSYLHGSGYILPWLEAELAGMKAGEEKSVFLSGSERSDLDDDFYIDLVVDEVRPATKAELSAGTPVPSAAARDNDCGPGCCC